MVRFSEQQVEAIMSGIEASVMLITGEEGYFKQFEAIQKRLAYLKQVDQYTVQGGHHFHMEGDVQKTAELIDSFLSE